MQHGHGIFAEFTALNARLRLDLLHEGSNQFTDIFAPVSQRWHLNRHNRQAVEEIFAEQALPDPVFNIDRC